MDSGEINKILGGILGAILAFLLLGFFSDLIYFGPGGHEEEDRTLAFAVEVEEGGGGAEEEVIDYGALLAAADPSSGASVYNKCKACHNLEDGANSVGPHLYGVVGREIANVDGFAYSDALMGKEGSWDLENLFHFIHNPSGWAPGTKMGFAGLPDNQDKVDLIVYLNEQSDSPVELVAPEMPEAAEGEGESGEAAGESAEGGGDGNAELIASADPDAGASVFKKCQACHRLEEGQNLVGPHLYGVVGREIASVEGFQYSDALASKEGNWDFDTLSAFLHDPQGWAPGTTMGFAGLDDEQDRADVIAYLNQQSDAPIDLGGGAATEGGASDDAAEAPAAESEATAEAAEGESTDEAAEGESTDEAAASESAGEAAEGESADEAAATEGDEATAEEEGAGDEATASEGGEAETVEGEGGTEEAAAEGETAPEPGAAAAAGPKDVADEEVETSAEVESNPTTALTKIQDEERVEPLPETEGEEAEEAAAEEAGGGDDALAALLASADPAAGEKVFRKCSACHRIEEGKNLIGPHLYGVVGRQIASVEEYSYSKALAEKEGSWEPAALDAFLIDPSGWAPGTKMGFAGLDDPQDRADLIAYLNQQSDAPMEFGALTAPVRHAAARALDGVRLASLGFAGLGETATVDAAAVEDAAEMPAADEEAGDVAASATGSTPVTGAPADLPEAAERVAAAADTLTAVMAELVDSARARPTADATE